MTPWEALEFAIGANFGDRPGTPLDDLAFGIARNLETMGRIPTGMSVNQLADALHAALEDDIPILTQVIVDGLDGLREADDASAEDVEFWQWVWSLHQ
jgi:hypothetical protein